MDDGRLSLPQNISDPQHYNSGCIVIFVGSGSIMQHISYSSPYIISLGISSVLDRTEGLLSKLEVFGQANTTN